jgi:glycosyltransferase involved in cell wall biosynthesis
VAVGARRDLRVGGPSVYGLGSASDIGGERYERELVRRLPAHGIQVLIGLPLGNRLESTPGVHAVVLRRPAGLHWVLAPLVFVPWVALRLLRDELDVLRGPSVRHTGPALLAARCLCRSNVPVVIHHHHFEPRWRWLEAAILRRADAVITVSEHSRAELVTSGINPGRIHVAYNGIDGPVEAAAEPAGTWPADGLRLLYLGRLEARKRPELALETLDRLVRSGQPASLVLAGEGPAGEELRRRVKRLGLTDRVRFLGRVSDARKWSLYDGAELLLFGSTLEGFGLVVAEAQSRGLPVIAASGTATAEALVDGRSGLLVAPTAEAFAIAAASLCDQATRGQMSRVARDFARRFTWDACAEGVATALRAARDGRSRIERSGGDH